MPYELIITRPARRQLAAIERYIARESSRRQPLSTLRLLERCKELTIAPLQGTRRDHLALGLRTTGFEKRITIAFSFDGAVVRIASFAYAGRRLRLTP